MKSINVLNLAEMTADHTKKLNEIAMREKKTFTSLIDKYSERYGNSRFWWATTLSSRNTNLERAFWNFCATKLVEKLLEDYNYEEIIVPFYSLKVCLEHNFKNTKVTCADNERVFYQKIKRKRDSSLRHIINTVRFNRKSAVNGNNKQIKNRHIYIIDTYDIASEFSNGEYKDRYFGGLDDNSDETIIYLSSLYYENYNDAGKIIDGINQLNNRYVIDKYYRWSDCIEIFLYWKFCKKTDFSDAYVDGLFYGDLLAYEIIYGKYSITSYYGLLKSKAVLRFINKNKAKINGFIGWYEGQPSSNALFFEIRRKTNIKTAAYLCTPLHEFVLGLSPSQEQLRKKGVAEFLCVQGDSWISQVKEYDDSISIVRAPSFRYKDVFAYRNVITRGKDILVVLSWFKESSRKLIQAIDQVDIDNIILLKNHPANDGMTLMDYGIDELACRNKYRVVSGNMRDSLSEVDIAVLTETTSALEVLLNGVKVVIWNNNGALRDSCVPPSLLDEKFIKVVYSEEELISAVNELAHVEMNLDRLQRMKEEVFTEPNRETVSAWLSCIS